MLLLFIDVLYEQTDFDMFVQKMFGDHASSLGGNISFEVQQCAACF